MGPQLSIFFHNYYGNDQDWINYFSDELTVPYTLFYNRVIGSFQRMCQPHERNKQGLEYQQAHGRRMIVRNSPNQGKDIGGKLVLMDAYLRLGVKSDYLLLLHDKQSPYHSNSQQWQKDLFRIAEKEWQTQIIDSFCSDPRVGIVASRNTIKNESDNDQKRDAYTESAFINVLKDQYEVCPPSYQYVAGTMFWVRASLYENFFTAHRPLEIRRTLEEGNVLDHDQPTHTHAWERLLSWLVTSQGYKIKGV